MKIAKSTFIVSFFTILSRILGFARDLLIAVISGASVSSDVFFMAFKMANFFRKVLSEGSFFAAFVPSFQKIREMHGDDSAKDFACRTFTVMLYSALFITILAELFMEQITAVTSPGFTSDPEKFAATVTAGRWLFLYFLMIILVSVMCGILNSIEKFSYYAIFPILLNVAMIFSVTVLRGHIDGFVNCLIVGVLLGGVLQFVFAYIGCIIEGFRPKIQTGFRSLLSSDVKATFGRFFPAIIATGMSQVSTLISMILGSYIPKGVSHLYYADRVFYLPTSVIGTALSVVILPALSRAINKGDHKGAFSLQNESFIIASFLVLPSAGILLLSSDIIVSILFEHGQFTAGDTVVVGRVLAILGASLPFVVYDKILASVFFANRNTRTPMYVNLYSILVNTVLSVTLVNKFGVYGVATGSVVASCTSVMLLFYLLRQKGLVRISGKTMSIVLRVVLASIASSYLFFYLTKVNYALSYVGDFYNDTLLTKLCYVAVMLGASVFGFFVVLFLVGINCFGMIWRLVKNRAINGNEGQQSIAIEDETQ